MAALEKLSNLLNRILLWIAGFFLVAMIVITCANIFIRIFWLPLRGTFELMGYFCAIVTAFALGYTQLKRGHIAVDIVVLRFTQNTRKIINVVNHFVCLMFFAIVAWQVAKYATTLWATGEVTETLQIVYYPFTYGVALGCLVLSFTFFVEFLKILFEDKESTQ